MQARLRDMIMAVKSQAVQLGEMAHRLANSAQQITGNVSQESDAVSSMAAAIEEISVSTTHIADQGSVAKRIATSSRSDAEQGASVVTKTVEGLIATAQEIERAAAEVSRLGEDSSRISGLVDVIKDIADQTNLLALNAAIEAARAGEQGRGFAVVADEVRKLSERTTGATSEISTMITAIQSETESAVGAMGKGSKQAGQGVELANQAVQSLQQINDSVTNVVDMIQQIAAATRSQSEASDVITTRVEHIAQMARDNGGSINQTTQASHGLQQLSLHLQQVISHFRL